jgi:protein-disulfide isomerase
VARRVPAVIVALALAAGVAGCGSSSSHPSTTTTAPRTTAQTRIARAVNGALAGIPQHGIVLGDPSAPVTLVEFLDPQCPYCKQFSDNIFPGLIRDYVRTGRVRMEERTLAFLGPDSVRGSRFLAAAARQNRQYQVAAQIYARQGKENSGYMTDAFLRSIAATTPGLDVPRAMAAARTPASQEPIASAHTLASRYDVTGTPTILVGRTGGDLKIVHGTGFTDPTPYTAALDRSLARAARSDAR